jgi:penicillin-binding protein activator
MKKLTTLLVLCAAATAFQGCETPAHVVSDDRNKVVSLDQIDVQDWTRAAQDAITKLANSGVLEQAPTKPAVVKITMVRNDTSMHVDTALLTQKVKIALMQTGKAKVMTQDEATQQLNDYTRFKKGDKGMIVPYYTLSGKIIEQRASAGKTRQTSYIFQLNLATVDDGLDAWSGETDITKQGTQNSVGY